MQRISKLVFAGLSLIASSAGATDWTHFRYDQRHTGFQPHEHKIGADNAKFLHFSWQADLGGELIDFSSPAVAGGLVYIGTDQGVLVAYPAKGCGSDFCTEPAWQSVGLAQIVDSPTVANGVVYVGSQTNSQSNDGKLNAFAAQGCGLAHCAPLWQGDAGSESILASSPVVWNGLVFVGTYGAKLFAFDVAGCGQALCQPVWTGTLGGPTSSTPVVYKGVLYIGATDGRLYAFDAHGCRRMRNCKPLWTADTHGAVFESSPAIADGTVYIASQHALSAFDAKGCGAATCNALWQAVDDEAFFGGSPAIADGRVYIPQESQINVYPAAGCGKPLCASHAVLFGSGMQDAILSSPTVANGVVYAGRNSGDVLAWRADCTAVCDEIWKGLTDDPIVSSSPTVVNGKVYIGSSFHGFSARLYVYSLN